MFIPRPTLGGFLFLAATAAALGVALMNVGLITALVASVFCSIAFSCFLLSFFTPFGISVVREKTDDGVCLGTVSLPLTVTNRFPFYRQSLSVVEKLPFVAGKRAAWEIPPLGPKEVFTLRRTITAERRGHFHLDPLAVVGGDPCGLFLMKKTFHLPGEATITPKIVGPRFLPTDSTSSNSVNREGRILGHAGLGSDFFGVRPYRPGDEIRYVHWRLTASKQELMIREFEASTTDRIILILDSSADSVGLDETENNFEALISAAASITDYLSSQYCYLTFITRFRKGNIMQISGDAAGVRVKIIELLTELEPSEGSLAEILSEVLESLPQGAVLYLLGMSDAPEIRDMLRLLEDQEIKLQWIHAPKEYFPFIEPDEPRIITLRPPAEPQEPIPYIMTFQSNPGELFQNEAASEQA
ncbi:MAG: hypothetical protein BWY31_00384 [Lentisphaerae bacterium ADurb.Bin242]|nr:MAG: hypothetical protein BWY31_00384 [Lentisphaerae bacterium ADurb.Bin242]